MDKTGQSLPCAIKTENAIIGACLIDNHAISEVANTLKDKMFYNQNNREIFRSVMELYKAGDNVDLLTVSNHLKKRGVLEKIGGDFHLIKLTQRMFSSAHIISHSEIVIQKYIQRELIKASAEIANECFEDRAEIGQVLSNAHSRLNKVSQEAIRPSEVSLNEVMEFQIRRSVDIYEGKIKPGIETPIEKLTKSSGGWRNGELIILAARPGMGKTAFCLASALKAGKNNHPTLIFSLEMSKEQLTNRILAMESGIESQRFTHLGLDLSGLTSANEAKERLKNLPLLIDDSGSLTIEDIIIKSKRLKAKNNIELIIVDYLQLISSVGDNREQQVSKISRSLKILAKDLDVPIIALSQLSRAVETRPDKRPRLSDLRDSGAIEQDADVVIFLFRPEYYGIFKWEEYYNYAPTTNEAEYIIAKNRQAENSRGRIAFNSETVLFLDLDS